MADKSLEQRRDEFLARVYKPEVSSPVKFGWHLGGFCRMEAKSGDLGKKVQSMDEFNQLVVDFAEDVGEAQSLNAMGAFDKVKMRDAHSPVWTRGDGFVDDGAGLSTATPENDWKMALYARFAYLTPSPSSDAASSDNRRYYEGALMDQADPTAFLNYMSEAATAMRLNVEYLKPVEEKMRSMPVAQFRPELDGTKPVDPAEWLEDFRRRGKLADAASDLLHKYNARPEGRVSTWTAPRLDDPSRAYGAHEAIWTLRHEQFDFLRDGCRRVGQSVAHSGLAFGGNLAVEYDAAHEGPGFSTAFKSVTDLKRVYEQESVSASRIGAQPVAILTLGEGRVAPFYTMNAYKMYLDETVCDRTDVSELRVNAGGDAYKAFQDAKAKPLPRLVGQSGYKLFGAQEAHEILSSDPTVRAVAYNPNPMASTRGYEVTPLRTMAEVTDYMTPRVAAAGAARFGISTRTNDHEARFAIVNKNRELLGKPELTRAEYGAKMGIAPGEINQKVKSGMYLAGKGLPESVLSGKVSYDAVAQVMDAMRSVQMRGTNVPHRLAEAGRAAEAAALEANKPVIATVTSRRTSDKTEFRTAAGLASYLKPRYDAKRDVFTTKDRISVSSVGAEAAYQASSFVRASEGVPVPTREEFLAKTGLGPKTPVAEQVLSSQSGASWKAMQPTKPALTPVVQGLDGDFDGVSPEGPGY